jgi:hypothetical protein
MAEADTLRFDPASEFEIIESLDFEEEVQRPEELRFFTLDEQLLDYFDKVLPKKKNVTKFEYRQIANEVDRVRELYQRTIVVSDTNYEISSAKRDVKLPWINPIYSDFEYSAYSFTENWVPIFERSSRSRGNYYPILVSALPHPYKTTGDGVPIVKTSVLVNDEGKEEITSLGNFVRTKSAIHEDGTMSVVSLEMPNTGDDMKYRGYFLGPRGVDIPNPMVDHPFLSSASTRAIQTQEELSNIFPTLEALMNHAIPTTQDPYGEGLKFLKVYDINLRDIPWKLWKDRFPPKETITASKSVISVDFPKAGESEPSNNVKDAYIIKWSPGVNPRMWLMSQEDRGQLVVKMVMSKSSEAGLVPPDHNAEKVQPTFPDSTPEDCLLTNTFDEFLNSGVYRSNSKVCIPATFIQQERRETLVAGKTMWGETTEHDILKEHLKLLKKFQYSEKVVKAPNYAKISIQAESELRREIRAILEDEHRVPTDKADAIHKIVRDLHLENKVYLDAAKLFVVCGHTLAELSGDLEKDRLQFYNDWTAIDEGFRSCRFCGEQINKDVLVAQDEFDENGKLIINQEVLPETGFHGESHASSFTNSLLDLKKFFLLDNIGETIFYLLLSLLQVLPTESQLVPVLQNVREITSVLKSNKKIPKVDKERIEGILGVAGMVVVLQTHNPFLIPRRSFGSKVLKLTGYPRDTEDTKDSPVLDVVISILKTTFEASPNTFKGPIASFLRNVLTKPKDVRKEALVYLKQASAKFKTQFLSARERYLVAPEPEPIRQVFLPLLSFEKLEYAPGESLGAEEIMSRCDIPAPSSYITSKNPPSVVQEPLELWKNLKPSASAEFLEVELDLPVLKTFTDAEIRKRITLGYPKPLKIDKLDAFLKSDTDGPALSILLNRMLDILSQAKYSLSKLEKFREASVYAQTRINKSLFRDAMRGLIYELLHEISNGDNKTGFVSALSNAFSRDLTLNMLLLTNDEAKKQDIELRTKERETFKQRMRSMDDEQRQTTKMLLDIGIAGFIITNEDREFFAREYKYPDPEEEYEKLVRDTPNEEVPDEGANAMRDNNADGDMQLSEIGERRQADWGGYGDIDERLQNEDDTAGQMDDGNGYGV